MALGKKHVEICDRNQIKEFDLIASDFFATIFNMDCGDCFVSDESNLRDFSGCGMPDSFSTHANNYKYLCMMWDTWIIRKIAQHYSLDLTSTNLSLVDLFNRISQVRHARVH